MNPFDQFADDFKAALPPGQQTAAEPNAGAVAPAPFNIMASAPSEKKPIMNAPTQQNGLVGGAMQATMQQPGPFGQQQMLMPNASVGGMMGAPPTMGVMSGSAGMQPPLLMGPGMQQQQPPPFGAGPGALVPSSTQSNPYSLGPSPGPGAIVNQQPPPFGLPTQQQPPFGGSTQQQLPYGGPPQRQSSLSGPPQQQNHLVPSPSDPFGSGNQASQDQQKQRNQFLLNQPPPAQKIVPMDPFGASDSGAVAPTAGSDPFGAPPAPPQQAGNQVPQIASDPWGGLNTSSPAPQTALVTSNASNDDPFGIFGGGSVGGTIAAPTPSAPAGLPGASSSAVNGSSTATQAASIRDSSAAPPTNGGDPWAEMGFGTPEPSVSQPKEAPSVTVSSDDGDLFGGGVGAAAARAQKEATESAERDANKSAHKSKPSSSPKRGKGELPPGGEWYDAKIFTPTLGVMFFKPRELVDSLFLQTDKKLVDALDDRPVVAFIVEGSSARSAGVELGHVLLKVNGIDVKNPKEASRLIKEGPRPLPLLFYVPDTNVVVAEGEHMVKYNTRETGAPNSAKDWKPKYVVIGGIIAQPWMMNMYRSKSEYDIAVIETQARRPVSVKVKQFSLQGARIQNDWQGPQMVKYKNKLHPWKYIVILPVSRNPIKIASPNLTQLKPVHEGIRRVLMAQQRDRGGGNVNTAGPIRQPDPYGNRRPPEYDDRKSSSHRDGHGAGGDNSYNGGGSRRSGY